MVKETYDWASHPEIEEFEYEPFFIPDIYYLEESKSAEEFYMRLSKMIFDVPKYNQQELEYLSKVVSRPWKKAKGRPRNDDRDLEITILGFEYFEDQTKPKKQQDFVNFIAKKYGMEFDAARKAIAKAQGPRRKKREIIDDDLFP